MSSFLQKWAVPLAGGAVEGAFFDPFLGATQLGTHALGAGSRALGYQWDPRTAADNFVNHAGSGLQSALGGDANPSAHGIGKFVGGILSPTDVLGPEAAGAQLARPAGEAKLGRSFLQGAGQGLPASNSNYNLRPGLFGGGWYDLVDGNGGSGV